MTRVKSTKDTTIQPKYQPDPESLVDSIAFGPVSKVEAWNDKLQIMKDHTPASCDKARELYKGIASGIKGERRWKSPGRRMDAAKALILSDKLQWIPEKCNPKAGKKKKSRTKRHAVKSHKMKRKRKHKQQSKQQSKRKSKYKTKYTRKMNRKTNNRRKTRRRNTIRRNIRRTRRRNVQMTRKRMMGGSSPMIDSKTGLLVSGVIKKWANWWTRYAERNLTAYPATGIITYYEDNDKSSEMKKREIDLRNCNEAEKDPSDVTKFQLTSGRPERVYFFQATNLEERDKWVEAINHLRRHVLGGEGAIDDNTEMETAGARKRAVRIAAKERADRMAKQKF